MRTIFFMGLVILLISKWTSAESDNSTNTSVRLPSNREKFVAMVGRRLQGLWARFKGEEDSFIGRCFGVARKLKFVMPMIIFKLGVIVTVLAFLTIFSLKTLGLLGLLLLINVSGAISKISAAFAGKHDNPKDWKPPQTVHFHVHQGKEGNYYVDHGLTASGWDDRVGVNGSDEDLNSLQSYNLYYKLNKNPFLRNYRDINS